MMTPNQEKEFNDCWNEATCNLLEALTKGKTKTLNRLKSDPNYKALSGSSPRQVAMLFWGNIAKTLGELEMDAVYAEREVDDFLNYIGIDSAK